MILKPTPGKVPMQEQVEKALSSAEDIIYICTALVLIIAAATLLIFSTLDFIDNFNGDVSKNISQLLDGFSDSFALTDQNICFS